MIELAETLSRLPRLDRSTLYGKFHALYGIPAPRRLSRALLELAIAHRLQTQAFGDLNASLAARLIKGKIETPNAGKAEPGTILLREWHGVHHTVTVHADGVEYRGQRYRSLTEVTKVISGQKRSGPRFFGLVRTKPRSRG